MILKYTIVFIYLQSKNNNNNYKCSLRRKSTKKEKASQSMDIKNLPLVINK